MRGNKNKTFKEIDKNFEYLYFARSYLLLAFLGAEKLLEDIKSKNVGDKNPLVKNKRNEVVADFVFTNNYLIAPVLYNLKHSIEVFLKSTALFLGDNFEEKHDIRSLFAKIKTKLCKLKNNRRGVTPFIRKVDSLEKLVIKYHQNIFLKSKIHNNFTMEDIMNDVFRYPDNKARISLEFFNIFPRFTAEDIKDIQKDLIIFYDLFYEIGETILEEKNDNGLKI